MAGQFTIHIPAGARLTRRNDPHATYRVREGDGLTVQDAVRLTDCYVFTLGQGRYLVALDDAQVLDEHEKQYNYDGYKGCVTRHVCRETGTMVGLYNARQAGLDDNSAFGERPMPWVTVCETHGALVNHHGLKTAQGFLPYPQNWCEACQRLLDERAATAK